jgi:hypothetical protein
MDNVAFAIAFVRVNQSTACPVALRRCNRTRLLLAEQAQFSIASAAIFWQKISHDSVFHGRQPKGEHGKACFESITTPKECVGFGGRVASMPIRRNFKSTWRQQSRQEISAA